MAGSFKTPCPSCEADVLVKGSNLIGKKIDCTKCKYRFTVPDPQGDVDDGFTADDKPNKKGNPKALVGILLGVVGLAVLIGGGVMMLGGDNDTPVAKSGGGTSPGRDRKIAPQPDNPQKDEGKKTDESSKSSKVGNENPVTGKEGDPPVIPPINNPEAKPKPDTPASPRVDDMRPPAVMKDVSNLLPNDSDAIFKIDFNRLRQTPVYEPFFDKAMREFFRNSMGFEAADLQTSHFCLVSAVREPFAVLRTAKPVSLNALLQRSGEDLEPLPLIKQRLPFLVKSNAFIQALARVVSAESLRNEAGVPITEEEKKRWSENKKMGLHFYDSQTIMIGDLATLQRFLGDLMPNGEPAHLTESIPTTPPATPDGGTSATPPTKIGQEPPPRPAETTPGSDDAKLLTSRPNYLTIKPDLKAMFNRLDGDGRDTPAISYVDRINKREFAFQDRDANTTDVIFVILRQFIPYVDILGVGINTVNKDKFTGTILMKYLSETDLKESVEKRLAPQLKAWAVPLSFFFGSKIEVTATEGGAAAPGSGTGGGVVSSSGGGSSGGGGRRGEGPPPAGGGNSPPGVPEEDVGGFATTSKVNVSTSDLTAVVDIDISISNDRWKAGVLPQLMDLVTQMKGRMMVLSGETTWHSLSSRFGRVLAQRKVFPQGVLPRDSNPARFGLDYPPDFRASFIVELLPYLGRGALRDSIQEKRYAWFAPQNLRAAQTWVPELLVPYYPQTSWRAFHPLAEGGGAPLGATNFVALAGLGRDAARYNPGDPEQSKLVGMTGYNWGSNAADVKDGMSNTIYMIQVPPGHNRPWIAGGGATVMGVDNEGNPISDFISSEGGKRGTYALMADGSVRFLPDTVDPKIFKAMVTRAGGETIDDDVKKLTLVPVPKGLKEAELKGTDSAATKPDKKDAKPLGKVDDAELKKFQGKWKVKAMTRGTRTLTAEELAAMAMTITIEGTKMTVEAAEGGSSEMTIRHLDPKPSPRQISFQNQQEAREGKITAGVYLLEGTKLRLRYLKNVDPDKRPSEVKNPGANAEENESYMELVKAE